MANSPGEGILSYLDFSRPLNRRMAESVVEDLKRIRRGSKVIDPEIVLSTHRIVMEYDPKCGIHASLDLHYFLELCESMIPASNTKEEEETLIAAALIATRIHANHAPAQTPYKEMKMTWGDAAADMLANVGRTLAGLANVLDGSTAKMMKATGPKIEVRDTRAVTRTLSPGFAHLDNLQEVIPRPFFAPPQAVAMDRVVGEELKRVVEHVESILKVIRGYNAVQ